MNVDLKALYDELDNVESVTGDEAKEFKKYTERFYEIRDDSIYSHFLTGKEQKQIALDFGISQCRVSQIIRSKVSLKFNKFYKR